MFSDENINDLLKLLNSELNNRDELESSKYALQVHTKGYFYKDIITAYESDDPKAIGHVVKTFRPITKGSIWKGVDNISRIFHKTGIIANGDLKTRLELDKMGFFNDYINDFINITCTKDPNAVSVWLKTEDGYKDHRIIETDYIKYKTDNAILFVHPDTKYKASKKTETVKEHVIPVGEIKTFIDPKYIYISENQYIILVPVKEENQTYIQWEIFDFKKPIVPWVKTGINETSGLCESPLAPFLPFGDYALLAHRTLRAVDSMFSYPRMTELVQKCTRCKGSTQEPCDRTEDNPRGFRKCTVCEGKGSLSIQSVYKIYNREINKEDPQNTLSVPSVEFHTPPVEVLKYNKEAWKEYLSQAETAIHISQRVETGNIESAKSKEYDYQAMYSWLDRISNDIYPNMQTSLNQGCILNDLDELQLEKQISFAMLTEFEAFQYLQAIINSEAPIFFKTNQVEDFLNRYISKSNPIHKIVSLLKKVDIFCFYSKKELQQMSDSGIIDDQDWKINAYAYPLLMRMYTIDPEVIKNEEKTLNDLLEAIGKIKSNKLDVSVE